MAQYLRICNFCHKEFHAQKANTKFCSHQCSQRGYKLKKRLEHAQLFDDSATIKQMLIRIISSIEEIEKALELYGIQKEIENEQLLTPYSYCSLMGIHRKTLDRMIQKNEIEVKKIGNRIFIPKP